MALDIDFNAMSIRFLHRRLDQKGFTVLELMIATMVFGVMMLIATTGMIQIGRAYYKGVVIARTQEAARSVMEDITRTIQFGGAAETIADETKGSPAPGALVLGNGFSAKAICVGNQRYTYVIGRQLKSGQHALWYDIKQAGATCSPTNLNSSDPSKKVDGTDDPSVDTSKKGAARELLGIKMRLAKFSIAPATGDQNAAVTIKIAYGDNDLLGLGTDPASDPAFVNTLPDVTCVESNKGGQFCAFSELSTFVTRRQ